jgi:hypothetical protein
MKTGFASCYLMFVLLFAPTLSRAQSSTQANSWSVLNKITHKRNYQIQTRDLKCTLAVITEVAADHIVITQYRLKSPSHTITVAQENVLRVLVGRKVYYSGRSSWSDVSTIRPERRESLRIVTTGGKTYKVKPPYTVDSFSIEFNKDGKTTKISKSEVAQVYVTVVKPLTDHGEYLWYELGPLIIFDPDFYAWNFHLEQYATVLLYDAKVPEDNSPVQCAK